MRLLRDLWTTSHRRMTTVAVLILLGATGSAVSATLAGRVLVERSGVMFAGLVGALVVAVGSDLLVGLVVAGLTADWAADVRRRLCRVAFAQDLPTIETTPVGELLDRIDGDVEQVAAQLRFVGVRIAQAGATGTLSVVAALLVWWPAGLAMLLLVVGLLVGLGRPARRISPARMHEEEAWSDLAAVMEEAVHGQDDVRTSLAQPYVLRLFAQRAGEVLNRGRRVWRLSASVTTIAGAAVRVVIAGLVCGGLWAVQSGHLDTARLTAVWFLALGLGGIVSHISRMIPELQYALGAWARVQLLRDAPQEPAGGYRPAEGDLEICGLTFRYPDRSQGGPAQPALSDVRLRFVRGRSYALIGRSGSGKSTLGKVLTRAVDVPRGTVFLGGIDLVDLDLEGLRRWVAVVPQRTEVLAGTLAENIALFDETLLDAAAGALHQLGLTSWVAELPDGLQTRLGEGGHVLSAGQEQLVAFARILVRDPQVVVLDEATARLDPVTEFQVQRATERLLAGRIGIVIAHRLSSVRRCDEVVVLADGRVVESGSLHRSQRFARLLASGQGGSPRIGGVALADRDDEVTLPNVPPRELPDVPLSVPPKTDPPPLPAMPPVRTMREILRLVTNDPRYGLAAAAVFVVMVILGLDGSVLPWLWADLVDGRGEVFRPALMIVAALLVTVPIPYLTGRWFPEWWVRQMLRISLRLVHGQTGPRRVSAHTPAAVVAQGGDTDRVVMVADNVIDQLIALLVLVAMVGVSGSPTTGAFFAGTVLVSGLAATAFGPRLERAARRTVTARAGFATALVSSLSAARTVKLAGAVPPVLAHLARLDAVRSDRLRREVIVKVWSRSTPAVASGLAPIGVWALYLAGGLSSGRRWCPCRRSRPPAGSPGRPRP